MKAAHQKIFNRWYSYKKWKPFPFQQEICEAYLAGKSGLLNAPTGSGKTYACFIPILVDWISKNADYKTKESSGLKVLWISPLRALSKDIRNALEEACNIMKVPWRVEVRTGDTKTSQRQKQLKDMPEVLITTPESMHLLLALKDNTKLFKRLETVVIDEWHELLGSKRGTQVELALCRLRARQHTLRTWAISATIGNLEEALQVLMGTAYNFMEQPIVRSKIKKLLDVRSIMPDEVETMPWGGHLGIKLLPRIIPIINDSKTTLVFTNTRSQAEIWYQAILDHAPELAGAMAMHHGSIEREMRDWVEEAIHEGILKAVVCTASLDLGVDFRPVETVIQIGGPKGVARFLQRAGRSGHRPDTKSIIYFLPTHALELMEAAALRESANEEHIEKREPQMKPFDVLVQYLVTLAVGEGFNPDQVYEEIITTFAYADLSREEYTEVLTFIRTGGKALEGYDEYHKVEVIDGKWKVTQRRIAQRHRMNIGTIVSASLVKVKFMGGRFLGTIEEYFISRLRKGDQFVFAGQLLEFIRVKEMTAFVKKAKSEKRGMVPQWGGGRMPLSSMLSEILRKQIDKVSVGEFDAPELEKLVPIFDLQQKLSIIPSLDQLLIEYIETKEGYHLFVFPFEGRFVHEVLSALVSYRIGQIKPMTCTMAFNDYGFELVSDQEIPVEKVLKASIFTLQNLTEDINRSINAAEMAKRTFRDIACISGLVFQGYPGNMKKTKHLQASTGLIFEVFNDFEPNHFLLKQAYNEVFFNQFEEVRLRRVMQRINRQEIILNKPGKPTPFSFPIMVERLREKMSTESLEDRVKRMSLQLK